MIGRSREMNAIMQVFTDITNIFIYVTQFQCGVYGDIKEKLDNARGKSLKIDIFHQSSQWFTSASDIVFYDAILCPQVNGYISFYGFIFCFPGTTGGQSIRKKGKQAI